MTVRGIDLPARAMWLAMALAGLVALGFVFLQAGSGISAGAAAAPTGSISCDATDLTYGEPLTCDVDASVDAELHWGDGTVAAATTGSHTISAVGPVDVQVTAGAIVLASHTVTIAPDVATDCDYGLPKPVFELAPGEDGAFLPYDYVYLAADGTKLFRGDDGYPATLRAAMDMDASILGEEPVVGLCRTVSAALDDLGGTASWVVDDGWYPAHIFQSRNVTPGTEGDWEGVQPVDVTLTVNVDGFEASERIGVYFGGCG